MGTAVRIPVILLASLMLVPGAVASAPDGASALPGSGAPAADLRPETLLDVEEFLYEFFESLDGATRAPCASVKLMPSDDELEMYPYLGEQNTGLEVNAGAGEVTTNLIVMAYPSSCVAWIQEKLTGNPLAYEAALDQFLP